MDYETLIQQSRHNAAIEAEEMNLVSILHPRVFMDGDKWCVLYGEDLMNGVAGFGDSPMLAVYDFNKAWRKEIKHDSTVAQQPAAVDGAMVERATMTLLGKSHDTAPGIDWRCDRAWTVNKVRKHMRAALTAALAGQQGGSDNDR